jgi:outer membrane cobalamin receptor
MVRGVVHGSDPNGEHVHLVKATVQWRGTRDGTFTDTDGEFAILFRRPGDTLEVRYTGYASAQIVVDSATQVIDVTLQSELREGVTVSADRTSISNATARTEVVTRRDLSKAACCSLAESFEKSPTVEVSFSDAVSGARQIRLLGLSGLYTQFMTETVPTIRGLGNPYGLDHIPGPFMESVSISKGASSVQNGFEGMTGQINVEFKKPFNEAPLFINAYGNSMGRAELNVVGSALVTDELTTSVMAHGRLFGAEVDQNNDGFLDMTEFRQLNVLNRWFFSNDEIEWQVLVRGVMDDYASGQLGATFTPEASSTRYAINTTIDRLEGFAKLGLLNVLEDMEGSSVAIVMGASYHDQQTIFGRRSYTGRQSSLQARGIAALPFSDGFKLNAGLSWQIDDITDAFVYDVPPLESLNAVNFDRYESVPGAYAEFTLAPDDDLTVVAGARVDNSSLYGTFLTPRLHARWSITPVTTVRGSVGRGWRSSVIIGEHISSFINARELYFDPTFRPEVSWNFGGSFTTSVDILGEVFVVDLEAYRTEFENQVIIDNTISARSLTISNLNGRSFATNIMAQVQFSPIERLDVMVAYRWLDVVQTLGGQDQRRPLVSPTRAIGTLSYSTEGDRWQFDATFVYNGPGDMPMTADNPEQYQQGTRYPGMMRINAQIQHRMTDWEFYLGIENATNAIQSDPIIAPTDPFGQFFDASIAWGPTDARFVYAGVRWTLPEW